MTTGLWAAGANQQALFVEPGAASTRSVSRANLVTHSSAYLFGLVATPRVRVWGRPTSPVPQSSDRERGHKGITTGPPLVDAGATYKTDANNAVTINLRQTNTAELNGQEIYRRRRLHARVRARPSSLPTDESATNGAALPGRKWRCQPTADV